MLNISSHYFHFSTNLIIEAGFLYINHHEVPHHQVKSNPAYGRKGFDFRWFGMTIIFFTRSEGFSPGLPAPRECSDS